MKLLFSLSNSCIKSLAFMSEDLHILLITRGAFSIVGF